MPSRRNCSLVLALIVPLLSLSGCMHHDGADPGALANPGVAGQLLGAGPWTQVLPGRDDILHLGVPFYPLAVGNEWHYDVHTRITLITSAGPQPPEELSHPLQALIVERR